MLWWCCGAGGERLADRQIPGSLVSVAASTDTGVPSSGPCGRGRAGLVEHAEHALGHRPGRLGLGDHEGAGLVAEFLLDRPHQPVEGAVVVVFQGVGDLRQAGLRHPADPFGGLIEHVIERLVGELDRGAGELVAGVLAEVPAVGPQVPEGQQQDRGNRGEDTGLAEEPACVPAGSAGGDVGPPCGGECPGGDDRYEGGGELGGVFGGEGLVVGPAGVIRRGRWRGRRG
jgi:hypothetical protein